LQIPDDGRKGGGDNGLIERSKERPEQEDPDDQQHAALWQIERRRQCTWGGAHRRPFSFAPARESGVSARSVQLEWSVIEASLLATYSQRRGLRVRVGWPVR
jgi:hypothetical protein